MSLRQPQRQSLWAVAFLALRTLRSLGLVQLALIVGFVIARLPSLTVFLLLATALSLVLLAVATLQWWRYTFQIVDDELVVNRGVLARQTLSIPLDRVQSVSLEQKLLHRIISLVQVSLDTAGTLLAEFVIDAVDKPVAVALQREVANHRGRLQAKDLIDTDAAVMPEPPESIVLRHDWVRVLQIALTQAPFAGLVVVGPLVALADDIGRFLPFGLPEIEDPTAGPWLYWFIPLLLLGGLLISLLLNIVRVLLAEWNLTVRSTSAGLRRDAGLLSTTSVATTLPRIQIIGIRQGLLKRLASLHTVTLRTIGVSKFQVPGCDEDEVAALRRLALDDSVGVEVLDQRVSDAEVFRVTRNALVGATVVSTLAWFTVGWWSVLALLAVPIVWALVRRSVQLRRWGWSTDALADRRELLGWEKTELLMRKINTITVRQTLFERKRGLATVQFATASGTLSIGMVPALLAETLRDQALFHVETDRGAWM